MQTESKWCTCIRLISLCLLTLFLLSCESKGTYVGAYRADAKESPRQVETILELKANGEGTWKMADEEVPFAWYTKQNELRLNTKGGGVVSGTFVNDTLEIALPNSGRMSFKKIH